MMRSQVGENRIILMFNNKNSPQLDEMMVCGLFKIYKRFDL